MAGAVLVIYGPPGSGKSFLARALSELLGVPSFDRDELKDLLFDSLGYSDRAWSVRIGEASWVLLMFCVRKLAGTGQSFIVESNFRPDGQAVEELRYLARLRDVQLLSIHLTAQEDILWRRFDERRRTGGRHPGHAGFEAAEEFFAALAAWPHGPIDLGGPSLTLDTSEAWPNVNQDRTVGTGPAARYRAQGRY